ncbi:hypothetical protein QBC37DRAFT_402091 [Rhypophila decipiens]|uniref:RRM domain-containing protein n=1 Tax=Rhypophila decipiens TaxID=261697 RepID=A0AAN6Y457_9PEZI|nr:hypothetical protein QBC37DRAFT_402091 [Rhypophila decipiens]
MCLQEALATVERQFHELDESELTQASISNQRLNRDYFHRRLNCSLRLSNLPQDVTIKEITDSIRSCGRIYKLKINPTGLPLRQRATAKVVFFDNTGASALLEQTNLAGPDGPGGIWIRRRRVRVTHSRHRIPPHLDLPLDHTRALRFTGPVEVINCSVLTNHFISIFRTDEIEEVIDHTANPYVGDVEFRFASYKSQALPVLRAVVDEELLWDRTPHVVVDFAPDPCA